MDTTQFNTMIQLFAKLSQEMVDFRLEMRTEFFNIRSEVKLGFEAQEAISHEVINTIGRSFEELEKTVLTTKKAHARRLTKIERHIGIA